MQYYDIAPLLAEQSQYNILFGGRGSGKSYAVKKYVYEYCIKNNKQFIMIVRHATDRITRSEYFDDLHLDITVDDKYNFINSDGVIFGKMLILNLESKYKSNVYEDVDIVVYEEFTEKNIYRYLNNETKLFMSIISTIFRHRTGQVFLIGNNDTEDMKYNMYFKLLGIDWDKLMPEQGQQYTLYKEDTKHAQVTLSYVPIMFESVAEISKMQLVADNDVATTGDFAKDNDVISDYNITHNNLFGVVLKYDDNYFTFEIIDVNYIIVCMITDYTVLTYTDNNLSYFDLYYYNSDIIDVEDKSKHTKLADIVNKIVCNKIKLVYNNSYCKYLYKSIIDSKIRNLN